MIINLPLFSFYYHLASVSSRSRSERARERETKREREREKEYSVATSLNTLQAAPILFNNAEIGVENRTISEKQKRR
jgi:hypothetical protein